MNWESLELSDTQTQASASLLNADEDRPPCLLPKAERGVRILILGLGNVLLRDEGVGVHVAELLQKEAPHRGVEVIDGGTAGLDILLSQQPPYKLVIIDAVKAGKKPGTIYKTQSNVWHPQAQLGDGLIAAIAKTFGFDAATPAGRSRVSLHQVGLLDALAAAERLERMPDEITIIGVEVSAWS
jgi:hydrogenase maturation protease